jgi:hypothetical protein
MVMVFDVTFTNHDTVKKLVKFKKLTRVSQTCEETFIFKMIKVP